MSTSFEFLPRSRRRLALVWQLPVFFALLFLGSLLLGLYLRESVREVQIRFDQEIADIENRRQAVASQSWALIPNLDLLENLQGQINRQNFSLIGPQTPWIDLFQILEEDLPESAVIAKIENPRTSAPGFPAGENDFRLLVVVSDNETSNTFYRKLSSRKALQSLSYTPKGETTHQGRKGIGIELIFHLGNAS